MQARGHRFESVILHTMEMGSKSAQIHERNLTFLDKETHRRNEERPLRGPKLESNVSECAGARDGLRREEILLQLKLEMRESLVRAHGGCLGSQRRRRT